jgi:hypothetical protein
MTVNPEVVDLLTRFDLDGSPLDDRCRWATPAEEALIGTATVADLKASVDMLAWAEALHIETREAYDALIALLAPWIAAGPTVQDAITAAPAGIAAEASSLLERVETLRVLVDGP